VLVCSAKQVVSVERVVHDRIPSLILPVLLRRMFISDRCRLFIDRGKSLTIMVGRSSKVVAGVYYQFRYITIKFVIQSVIQTRTYV
jgi:hypothetical protein